MSDTGSISGRVSGSISGRISSRMAGRAVLVVGRAGMDLYPVPDGIRIEDADELVTDVGGSAGNIAVALAKLLGVLTPLHDLFNCVSRELRKMKTVEGSVVHDPSSFLIPNHRIEKELHQSFSIFTMWVKDECFSCSSKLDQSFSRRDASKAIKDCSCFWSCDINAKKLVSLASFKTRRKPAL